MSFARSTRLLLILIVAAGAAVRFYGLNWGAPYYHFHIDEHFVFLGGLELRKDFFAAANSPKFFMYSPLPMYILIGLTEIYETITAPLNLALKTDGIRFMVLGRSISAAFGTATIPLVYLIASRVSTRTAGLLAAALTAAGVLHLRDSHFLSVDVSLTFFCILAWLALIDVALHGAMRSYVLAGVAIGAALLCKYSAAFLLPLTLVAHLCAPGRPTLAAPWQTWIRWLWVGAIPGIVAVLTFLVLDPHVLIHFDKFRFEVQELVLAPMGGAQIAIWAAHFTNIQPRLFWFTNILWWGLGPAFEIWALLGVAWLLWRRDRAALMAAAFPIVYYLVAGRTGLPFARYGVPLVPALAVAAGVLSADLLRKPAWRRLSLIATTAVIAATILYAVAYMNIYVKPDSRLAASEYIHRRIPEGSAILVEPSHNIPPMGSYLTEPSFDKDYVLWGPEEARPDYYRLYALDTYRYLYGQRPSPEEKRGYIERRVALADYIVIDDTYVQFYGHLPAAQHGVVKRYYDDLFNGRLGFELMRTFKVYPRLGGRDINDDRAELTFRLFDHPRVFVFRRRPPSSGTAGPSTLGGR
jgi:4-amino-4-deoxy-L-arabinose transferase-like glycosyltransferase